MWNNILNNHHLHQQNPQNSYKRNYHQIQSSKVVNMGIDGTGYVTINPSKQFHNPNYMKTFNKTPMVDGYKNIKTHSTMATMKAIPTTPPESKQKALINKEINNNNNNMSTNNKSTRRKRRNRRKNKNKEKVMAAAPSTTTPTTCIVANGTTSNCFNLLNEFSPLLKDIDQIKSNKQRRISTTSEDSFIVFYDQDDVDEGVFTSEDDSETTSLPRKRVRFADDNQLCEIHPMVQWSYAYQQARKGPWEEYARDRERFQQRIQRTGRILDYILKPEHRQIIYKKRFYSVNEK